MDIDPKDLIESANSAAEARRTSGEKRSARLNAAVAVTVAVLATFMGICKVKDDNIVQGMQGAQVDKLDHWAYYQARNLRQQGAETSATQLELARLSAPAAAVPAFDAAISRYRALEREQATKKEEMKTRAEQDQRGYDALNFRDDQFDLSDAFIAIAIAMLAVTALTQLWPLYWAALIPTSLGVLMGLAGLLSLPLHPDTLVKLLS